MAATNKALFGATPASVTLGEWTERAACRGTDPSLFFPDAGQAVDPQAVATCARCPVLTECDTHATTRPERHGVWAGALRTPTRRRRSVQGSPRQVVPSGVRP